MSANHIDSQLLAELVPTGHLRVGLNMSNFLLITGTTDAGEPDGVSPDMARAIAERLGVAVELIPFKGPGEVADAASEDRWDIGNIAAEAERARTISFSPAYCEIQATCLVPAGSGIRQFSEVDQPGNRIAVKERSAYDLWLTEHLQHASLVREASVDDSLQRFIDDGLEVLAGLRPKLLEQQQAQPGSRVLDDRFTAVQQSIGCRLDRPLASRWLADFVAEAITSGAVQALIDKHGVTGKLSVAAATPA